MDQYSSSFGLCVGHDRAMSQHARIEELSDSDSDPPEDELDNFVDPDIIRPSSSVLSAPSGTQKSQQSESSRRQTPVAAAAASRSPTSADGFNANGPPPADFKTYQCLYPIYFDLHRSRAEGRRVGKKLAVANPLARELVEAVQDLGLKVVFEPGKMHPKDWSNPGRVKVGLKDAGSRTKVKNSKFMSTYLWCFRSGCKKCFVL